MSRYTVEWTQDAEDALADIWMQAADRAAVTAAEAAIHRLLEKDPVANGAEVSEGLRRIIIEPLVALYTVDASRRVVEVEQVGVYSP
jgi:plasmid stabilization system protein ParE